MGSEQGGRSQASPGSFRTVTRQRRGPEEEVTNGTSTFATRPGRPVRFFDPRFCDQLGAATGPPGTQANHARLEQRPSALLCSARSASLRRNSSCRKGKNPVGRGDRIMAVPWSRLRPEEGACRQVYAACARLAALRRVSNHQARPWPPVLPGGAGARPRSAVTQHRSKAVNCLVDAPDQAWAAQGGPRLSPHSCIDGGRVSGVWVSEMVQV